MSRVYFGDLEPVYRRLRAKGYMPLDWDPLGPGFGCEVSCWKCGKVQCLVPDGERFVCRGSCDRRELRRKRKVRL